MPAVPMFGEGRVCRCRTKGSLCRWAGPGLRSAGLDYSEPSRSKEEGVLLWVRIAVDKAFHLIYVNEEPH